MDSILEKIHERRTRRNLADSDMDNPIVLDFGMEK